LGARLAHRLAGQRQAMGVVQQAVENGIGKSGLADELVLVLNG